MLWSGFSLKQISRWTMVTAKSVLLTINCLCVKVLCLSCVVFLTSKMAELTFTMRKKAAGHMRNNLPQAVFKKSIKITEYTFTHLICSSSTKLVSRFPLFPIRIEWSPRMMTPSPATPLDRASRGPMSSSHFLLGLSPAFPFYQLPLTILDPWCQHSGWQSKYLNKYKFSLHERIVVHGKIYPHPNNFLLNSVLFKLTNQIVSKRILKHVIWDLKSLGPLLSQYQTHTDQ